MKDDPSVPVPDLTPLEWQAIRRRLMCRAVQLAKSVPKAKEMVDATIAAVLHPEPTSKAKPWDPERQTFGDYLLSRLWSRHGTELKSYRVTMASDRITEDNDRGPPSSQNPDRLAMRREDEVRAERCHAALLRRVAGDALILLLLEQHDEDYQEPADDGGGSDDVKGEGEEPQQQEGAAANPEPRPVQRVAEPASTRRAVAKGYTHKEIKNARERLKRHAIAAKAESEAKR